MKFKKVLCVLLLVSMVGSLLSGCTKKEIPTQSNDGKENGAVETNAPEINDEIIPEEGAELDFWTLSGDSEFGNAVASAFEEKYGVKVNVQENGLDTVNKMMLDGPTGNGADVFMAAHDQFMTAKDAGIIAELDESISRQVIDQVDDTAIRTVMLDGKLYGVPVAIETYALLYNKTLVTGEPATTFEQIKEEALAYNKPSENKFWYLTVPTDGYPAYLLLSLDGFQLFGADGFDNDNPGFNTPEFEKGLERIASIKEILPIKADDLKMETMSLLEQNFKEGKTAYYPIGPWLIKSLKDENVDFGVTTLPTYEGKQMKSFSAVQNAYVSAYTEYPKAAQLFAAFLVSDEAASLLYSKSYRITSKKDISNVEGLMEDQELKVFSDSFKTSVPMPSAKRISYYWTITQGVLSSVFDGNLTPKEGAEKAQKDFEDLVASE